MIKKTLLHFLLIILIVVAIAGVISISFFSCCYAFALARNPGANATVDELLSAGIGIIGIMVAVWTALTISNVISRKDIDDLNLDIEIAKGNMASIDAYIEKDLHIQAEHFFVEASRNYWDPLLSYLVQNLHSIEREKNFAGLFSDLTIIELKYTQVRNQHQNAYVYDKNLIDIADEGLAKIDSIMKSQDLHDSVQNYLSYRRCGFNFYAGYCEKDKISGIKRFVKAALGYRKLESVFFVSPDKNEKTIPGNSAGTVSEPEQSNALRKCHLFNSIGESYSKIVQYYSDDSQSSEIQAQYRGEISQHARDAIEYCKKAANEEAGLDARSLSVFFRNLGFAYERADRLAKANHKESPYFPIENHQKEIIKSYKCSIYYAIVENSPFSTNLKPAYSALLTYLLNCMSEMQESSDRNLSKDFYAFERDALNCFPLSYEIVTLNELERRFSNEQRPFITWDREKIDFAAIRRRIMGDD